MGIPNALLRKWWFMTIRERNYFGFRYWWFNYILLLLVIGLFIWFWPWNRAEKQPVCDEQKRLDDMMLLINAHLNDCCSCFDVEDSTILLDSIPPQNISQCNATMNSGGEGITTTRVQLGNVSGYVKIQFEMAYVPDKLEVFYEGKVFCSTRDIAGNQSGFVGDAWHNGDGDLTFYYQPKTDDYVVVVVTGGDSNLGPGMENKTTQWAYGISCPQ